ncbi:thioredoxin family protein [Aneurinibacillus thermoaerophilus]|jgi:thioredoxin-related protein|uniref:thioredoxin family protein n=1 Tax=Aneurinibacillus thermoaerophilus TaxID=143495 RepID=UPI002E21433C|nr:thioredoxin family protein [Aneurinibacillus thermoaerophilus]MED0738862.1 thioredoxin family protein [Aneurinibacillus thermoaerophilus]
MKHFKKLFFVLLIGVVMSGVLVTAITAASSDDKPKDKQYTPGSSAVKRQIIAGNMSEEQKEDDYLVVYFSNTCQACHEMTKEMERYSQSPSALPVYWVEVNGPGEDKTLAKYRIRKVPTIIRFNKHKEIWRSTGLITSEYIPKV